MSGLNCYDGHGADKVKDTPKMESLAACKALCVQDPQCEGVVMGKSERGTCYERRSIVLGDCSHSETYSTHVLDANPPSAPSPPHPPLPPSPPPLPPQSPQSDPVVRINSRFVNSEYSNDLEVAGVLLHQFDQLENKDKPWESCVGDCYCQGANLLGRISAMLIYHQMKERRDRTAIPLPFSDRTGYILNPRAVTLECLYGVDGSTAFQRQRGTIPGCPESFCNADHPGGCGFEGWPIGAWKGSDLAKFMPQHQARGSQYHSPGFHSGYNEVILNSAKMNAKLPHTIEAWFVVDAGFAHRDGVGYDVVKAHRDFLRTYSLTANDVPLLKMDPANWKEPFSVLEL